MFVIATLLHFYYDGFIWRVRQSETQRYLNVQGVGQASSNEKNPARAHLWAREWLQVVLVMSPLIVQAITQHVFHPSALKAHQALAEVFPNA